MTTTTPCIGCNKPATAYILGGARPLCMQCASAESEFGLVFVLWGLEAARGVVNHKAASIRAACEQAGDLAAWKEAEAWLRGEARLLMARAGKVAVANGGRGT